MTDQKPIHTSDRVSLAYQEPGRAEITRLEKIHVEVFQGADIASIAVAREIADLIRAKEKAGEQCVLGLATGSSPIRVYAELVRMHQNEGLSLRNVITFNLDEYFPIAKEDVQSYHTFMQEHLFHYVDILPENIHIPDGTIPPDNVYAYCKAYEAKISSVGGLDFQLLGIGRNGHIGFNEPDSHPVSYTRLITLDHMTRVDAARAFHGLHSVPRRAITMGIQTIKQAKRIILLAWGSKKAEAIASSVEGDMTPSVPASLLQDHSNTTFVLDRVAAEDLTRFKTPWLLGAYDWGEVSGRKAIVWLSTVTQKPILRLTECEYNDHGMSSMLMEHDSVHEMNTRMYTILEESITEYPCGYSTQSNGEPSRIIIFSPHPDDDVISMGGTFLRLVDQGHEVHVVYQTSGNIAVADHDALRYLELIQGIAGETGVPVRSIGEVIREIHQKQGGATDSLLLRKVKGLIRRGEATAAARYCGLSDSQIHFLDLPFYETGKIKKNPLGVDDVELVRDSIATIRPHQIYAAGDLADPHGTHRVCLDAIFAALQHLRDEEYMERCEVWLYRGAWQEWPIHQIEMAIPLSPDHVQRKKKAIFFHQSQKDGVLFPGEDNREFWQRAEARNRATAKLYNDLGLPEYEAIEAFVQYRFR